MATRKVEETVAGDRPVSRGQALRIMAKYMTPSHKRRVTRSKIRHMRKAHGFLGR